MWQIRWVPVSNTMQWLQTLQMLHLWCYRCSICYFVLDLTWTKLIWQRNEGKKRPETCLWMPKLVHRGWISNKNSSSEYSPAKSKMTVFRCFLLLYTNSKYYLYIFPGTDNAICQRSNSKILEFPLLLPFQHIQLPDSFWIAFGHWPVNEMICDCLHP